jgi:uncharacterized protein YqjF (DUF2071 family)
MSFLKDHPFAVEAFFDSTLVLTFAVPYKELEHFLPYCFDLDKYEKTWAFFAVATVQTRDLRPKGFPKILGSDFYLTGYRLFVTFHDSAGRKHRGLYILKSETDSKKMMYLGNFFTHYNYSMTDVKQTQTGTLIEIKSDTSGFHILVDTNNPEMEMPKNSPLEDWKDARRFTGPLPYTFRFDKTKKAVLSVLGGRRNWKPQLVKVLDYNIPYLNELNIKGAVLASAFLMKDIPYFWKKGEFEKVL